MTRKKPPPLRWILFFALMVAVTLILPTVLIRAWGYRIDLAQRRLVATGALAISAFPAEIEVRIDQIEVARAYTSTKYTGSLSGNIFFSNLLPGTYKVTAKLSGYDSWAKTVSVDEGKTTAVPFVRLFQEKPSAPSLLFSRAVKGMATDENGSLLLGWDNKGIMGIDLKNEAPLAPLSRILFGDVSRILVIGDNALLVFFTNGAIAELKDIHAEQPTLLPFPGTFRDALPIDENRIVAMKDDGTIVMIRTTESPIVLDTLSEQNVAFTQTNGVISFLDTHGIVWSMRDDGTNRKQRTIVPLQNITAPTLVSGPNADTLALIDEKGTAWILQRESDRFTVIADGVNTIRFSRDGTKLLIQGPHELSLYAVEDRLAQPVRIKGSRETITRLSEPILGAFFLPQEEEHVVVLGTAAMYIMELDGRGTRNESRYDPASAAVAPWKGHTLIFTDTQRQRIFTVAIPRANVLENIRNR